MKNKKTFRVVMLATEKANPDYIIFFRTRNVHGASIDSPCLEASSNKTFIRNVDLINQGRAETNAQDKYEFQNLYIISNDEIKKDDKVEFEGKILTVTTFNPERDRNMCYAHYDNGNGVGIHRDNFKKIIASTDKSITPNSWIPESFVNAYMEAHNEDKPITEVDLEMYVGKAQGNGTVDTITRLLKTRSDGSVIIHERKMYSREEVKELIYKFSTKVFSEKFEMDDTNKWIEEHLK